MKMAMKKKKPSKKSYVKDYTKLFKKAPAIPFPTNPQWSSEGDYFQKFTLYKDTPSIASPGTQLLLNS